MYRLLSSANPFNQTSSTAVTDTSSAFYNSILASRDAAGRPLINQMLAFFIIVLSALALGIVISLLYKNVTKKGQASSRNFSITLVMLPPVIAAIVYLIGSNYAAAFSLAGIFSFTRFRSEANNAKDISFIFVAMALGIANGTGFIFYGFAIAIILCMVLLILNVIGYGEPKTEPKILRITVPESLNYDEIFDSILAKYTDSWDVTRVKTIDLGAAFELTYKVSVKVGSDEKAFIDELRTRNGNMSIILRLDDRRER